MRLVQLSVETDKQDAVVAVLREYELGYTVTAGAGDQDDRVVVAFLSPADAVAAVLADVREEGIDDEQFTVSVNTQFATFEGMEAVQDRWADTPNRIAAQALRSKAKSMRPNRRAYLWMMLLSTVVATVGLLQDSPAVVVGSMVIAPIVGPMLTASIGAVRDDQEMFIESLHMQALGLGMAVLGAVVFSYLLQWASLVPGTIDVGSVELVAVRLAPSSLTLIVGLAAGAAGAFGLATKGQVSLVGVMVAAALIPTAAVVGIALAWGPLVVALGAAILLVLTVLAVNLGSLLMLSYLGYRPDEHDQGIFSLASARQAGVVVGTLGLAALVAAAVLGGFLLHSGFESQTTTAVTDTLDDERYRDLGIVRVGPRYVSPWLLADPTTVTVTLSRSSAGSHPDLPRALARNISERTGRNVVVEVQYVEVNRSDGPRVDAEAPPNRSLGPDRVTSAVTDSVGSAVHP